MKETPLDIDRQNARNLKVARTLIRLKHSLNADTEIEEFDDAAKKALLKGGSLRATVSLKELLGK